MIKMNALIFGSWVVVTSARHGVHEQIVEAPNKQIARWICLVGAGAIIVSIYPARRWHLKGA